jgi:hypothetical protein
MLNILAEPPLKAILVNKDNDGYYRQKDSK